MFENAESPEPDEDSLVTQLAMHVWRRCTRCSGIWGHCRCGMQGEALLTFASPGRARSGGMRWGVKWRLQRALAFLSTWLCFDWLVGFRSDACRRQRRCTWRSSPPRIPAAKTPGRC